MTDISFVSDLHKLAEAGSTLRQLLELPPESIDRLLALVSDPEAVAALRHLLHSVHEVQTRAKTPSAAVHPIIKRRDHADLERALDLMFRNTARFPTVASIASFVREAFDVRIPHAKKQRERYIRTVLAHVRKSPKAKHYARNLLMHGPIDPKDERYDLLYKFIRGSLTE